MKISPIKTAIAALENLNCPEGLVEVSIQTPKLILIETIWATHPGKGWGLRCLREVTRILDANQCAAVGYLEQDSPTGIDRLRRLYQHFGFQEVGFLKMQRQPKPCPAH